MCTYAVVFQSSQAKLINSCLKDSDTTGRAGVEQRCVNIDLYGSEVQPCAVLW